MKHRIMLVAMVGREAQRPQDAVSAPVTCFTNHALSE